MEIAVKTILNAFAEHRPMAAASPPEGTEEYLLYYRRNVYGVPSCSALLEWRENPAPGPGWEVVAVCLPKPKPETEGEKLIRELDEADEGLAPQTSVETNRAIAAIRKAKSMLEAQAAKIAALELLKEKEG